MNKNINQDEHILRKIESKPQTSQRELAKELSFSSGKLNYYLKELKKKDLLKYKTSKNKKELNYLYVLTPKGIVEKPNYFKVYETKMKEYDEFERSFKKK